MQTLVALSFSIFFAVMMTSDAHRRSTHDTTSSGNAALAVSGQGKAQIAEMASLDNFTAVGHSLSCDSLCEVAANKKVCETTVSGWMSSMGNAISGWANNLVAIIDDGIDHGEIIQELFSGGWCDMDNCMPEDTKNPTKCISTVWWKRRKGVAPPAKDIVQITATSSSSHAPHSKISSKVVPAAKTVVPVAVNLRKARLKQGITKSQKAKVRIALGKAYVACQDNTGDELDGCCMRKCFKDLDKNIVKLGAGIKASCVKGCVAHRKP